MVPIYRGREKENLLVKFIETYQEVSVKHPKRFDFQNQLSASPPESAQLKK